MDSKELKIHIIRVEQNDAAGIFCNKVIFRNELDFYSRFFLLKIYICTSSVSK